MLNILDLFYIDFKENLLNDRSQYYFDINDSVTFEYSYFKEDDLYFLEKTTAID